MDNKLSRHTIQRQKELLWGKFWINIFVFIFVFILTLGFELGSNLVLLGLVFVVIEKVKIQSSILIISSFLVLFLALCFFVTENDLYFKYWFFLIRMMILINMFNYIFLKRFSWFKVKFFLDKIFYLHILCIIICFLSPQINSVIYNIFSYGGREPSVRISGFFYGFDIISFFVLVYQLHAIVYNL